MPVDFRSLKPQTPAMTHTKPQAYNAPPKNPLDTVFANIANAKTYDRNPYFGVGVYPMLYVDVFKLITMRTGEIAFIGEFSVLESQVAENPVGSKMAMVVKMSMDIAPQLVKAVIATTIEGALDGAPIDDKALRYCVGEENPCHGRLVRCVTRLQATKRDSSKMYTAYQWMAIPEEIQANAEQYYAQVFSTEAMF